MHLIPSARDWAAFAWIERPGLRDYAIVVGIVAALWLLMGVALWAAALVGALILLVGTLADGWQAWHRVGADA
jgi:uncharacterized membrane protein YphA (DoxX/SURF4 family)